MRIIHNKAVNWGNVFSLLVRIIFNTTRLCYLRYFGCCCPSFISINIRTIGLLGMIFSHQKSCNVLGITNQTYILSYYVTSNIQDEDDARRKIHKDGNTEYLFTFPIWTKCDITFFFSHSYVLAVSLPLFLCKFDLTPLPQPISYHIYIICHLIS